LMRVLAEHGAPLPTVKRVTSAGAPVPPGVVARMRDLLPQDAQFWTPYGATECLPVAVVEGRELGSTRADPEAGAGTGGGRPVAGIARRDLESTRAATEAGAGTCVGRPVPPNEVRVIRIEDDAIVEWNDELLVAPGVVGEITVAGPTATDTYFHRDVQTRLAKIREGTRIVHRMRHLGYFDGDGRLWFCGRKSQRAETAAGPLYTEHLEPVFAAHPAVARAALVGIGPRGAQTPVVCIELHEGTGAPHLWGRRKPRQLFKQLQQIANQHPHTRQ